MIDWWLTYWLIDFRRLQSCLETWPAQKNKTKAKTYIQRYSGYEAWICESWCQSMEKAKTTFCWALVHPPETMKQAESWAKLLSFFITFLKGRALRQHRLGKLSFLGQQRCFKGKKCIITWYILYIILNYICKFAIMCKKDAFVAKIADTCLSKMFG